MAASKEATALLNRTRTEIQEQMFDEFFSSIIEQSEMSPEQQAMLATYTDPKSKHGEILAKRDDLAALLHRVEAEAAYIRAEEIRLAERRHALERFVSNFESGIKVQMENWGVKRVEGRTSSFFIKKNPARVEVFNEDLLPSEFFNYTTIVNKTAIKDALERGIEVPGARFADPTTHIEVK